MSETILKIVGQEVRRRRKLTGLSQEGFAARSRFDRAFYGRIERGDQNISLITLCQVADALGATPAELLEHISLKHCRSVARPPEQTD